MRVLYLLTTDLAGAGASLRREHAREHEVAVIDLRDGADPDRVLDAIEAADRVLCW